MKFFQACTSRSRSFITTVFHSSIHFFPILFKGLYQTELYSFTCNAVSMHLNHRKIFLFSTRCGVGSLLCMRNINCKLHWLATCCLSRIFYFFLDRQFRSEKTIWWIFSVNHANNNLCTWQNAFSRHRMDSSLWFKRMELVEVKSFIWTKKGELYIIYENVMWILGILRFKSIHLLFYTFIHMYISNDGKVILKYFHFILLVVFF